MDNGLQFEVDGDTPCLFYGHKRTQTLYSVSSCNPKASLKRIPQFRHKKILDYSHGWFVLRDWTDLSLFFLYNPVTLELINLPPLLAAQPIQHIWVTIKSPPDCDDNCLLLLYSNADRLMFLCSPSKPNCVWLTQRLEVDGERVNISSAVTRQGVFYVLVTAYTSGIEFFYELHLDVLNSRIIFKPWMELSLPCSHIIKHNHKLLVESCGQLYCVCLYLTDPMVDMSLEVLAIKVFELDICNNNSTWREIDSLNGRSFFLGCASPTWCWGNTTDNNDLVLQSGGGGGIQSNCIYLLLRSFVGRDDILLKLYLYNLSDQSFMPLRHCPDLMRPLDYPVWVIPQQPRLLLSMNERIKKVDDHHHHPHQYHHGFLQHNDNEGQQTSRCTDLPTHLVEYLSKSMHLFEYWNFRATCKVLRSVCPPPRWRTNNTTAPLFMIFNQHNNKFGSCKIIDPHRSDPRFTILPLSPSPFTLKLSNKGWLVSIVEQTKRIEFCNVFTGAKGELGRDANGIVRSIGFSTYPTDPDCLTVALDAGSAINGGRVSVYYLRSELRARLWGRSWFDGQFSTSDSNPVFLDGAFYFLDITGKLGVYRQGVHQIGKPTKRSGKIYDRPETIKAEFHSCNLVECEGKLYAVFMDSVGKWIQIYRFDETEDEMMMSMSSWIEIKCLENRCFFISRVSSFSIVTSDPRMRNKIYLPRFKGNKMIYYSLDTRKLHVLGSQGFLENLYGATEPSSCCWIGCSF